MLEVNMQSHALQCSKYQDLRVDMVLEKDGDMIRYFRKVLKRRSGDEARKPAQQDLH